MVTFSTSSHNSVNITDLIFLDSNLLAPAFGLIPNRENQAPDRGRYIALFYFWILQAGNSPNIASFAWVEYRELTEGKMPSKPCPTMVIGDFAKVKLVE